MDLKVIDNNQPKILHSQPLTEIQRRHELKRITVDNQKMLQRIRTVPPTYSNVLWDKEAELQKQYIKTISEFPAFYDNQNSPGKTQTLNSNTNSTESILPPIIHPPFVVRPISNSAYKR